MVLYFFRKYVRQVCILHVWVKEWKSIGFRLFWPKKPIVKFNGAILFIVIITLCGQYRCYLYIHLLMSVSSDQTTYHSSLCMWGGNAGTHWKLLRRVVSLDKNYIIIIIIKNRNFCWTSDCKHLYLQYWWILQLKCLGGLTIWSSTCS